jgi:hypothetical protein
MPVTNQTIGSHYDAVKNRTFSFEWNSAGNHGIYVTDMVTEAITPLIIVGAATHGDVLGFNLQVPIIAVNILYGDSTQGDVLYYIDSLYRPSRINIDKALAGDYGTITRAMLSVAKAPPVLPPQVVYEHDNNVTANNLKGSLFQFACVHQYTDKERSVFSSFSKVPLPGQPFLQANDTDVKKNSRIAVYVETGSPDVKKLLIMVKQATGGIVSEWKRVVVLDKAALGIADNSVYRYVFYNDGQYPAADPKWAALLFDYVPEQAEGQELLNGVIPAYAAVTEGIDPVATDITAVVSTTALPYATYNGILFFAYQQDSHTLALYVTGAGTNNGDNLPTTLNNVQATFEIGLSDVTGSDKSFSYGTLTPSATIATILTALRSAALTKGFSVVSLGNNSLVLQSDIPVRLHSSRMVRQSLTVLPAGEACYALVPEASYSYGIEYFNEQGRTGGVFTQNALSITTPALSSSQLPKVQLTIHHRPPMDATYFHIVRTNQQTYGKRFNWVSNSACSNYSLISGVAQTFAYIGIDNIDTFNKENSASGNLLGYEYSPGDRIRFYGRFAADGTRTALSGKDYEVLGMVVNPVINGITKYGRFIKINYPAADISSDFAFDGREAFQNYQLLLYSLAARAAATEAVFYETGTMYRIANAGTSNAVHGGDTTQSEDLSQPAIVTIAEGEQFFRSRSIPAGMTYEVPAYPFYFGDQYATFKTTLPANITTTQYFIHNQNNVTAGVLSTQYPTFAVDDYAYFNNSFGTQTFAISGDVQLSAPNQTVCSVVLKLISPSNSVTLVTILGGVTVQKDATTSAHFEGAVQVPAGYKVFGLMGNSGTVVNMTVAITNLQYRVIRNITIPMVEDTFSDVTGTRMANNSRPTVVQPEEKRAVYGGRLRYGNAYQQDTDLNDTNRFYEQNYVEVDRSRGAIKRIIAEERLLYIYQQRAVGVIGIYTRFLKDNNTQVIEVATDEILSRDNVQYLAGEYGVNDYPESIVRTKNAHFFVDVLRGYIVARYNNGLEPVSEERYGNVLIRNLLLAYSTPHTTANGGKAMILGTYDYYNEQALFVLQGWQPEGEQSVSGNTFAYSMKHKGFTSFYTLYPEWIANAQEKILGWLNGDLFIHDSAARNTFFGTTYDSSVTVVFKQSELQGKTWIGVTEMSNVVWDCPAITSQSESFGITKQQSKLVINNFRKLGGKYAATFKRDIHSRGGWLNGTPLKGDYLVVQFRAVQPSSLVYLSLVSVKSIDNPFNVSK